VKTKHIKPILVSVGLSLLTALLAILIGGFILSSKLAYGVFIVAGCFFIGRYNPKSLWYGPILCNAMSIISFITRPNARAGWMYMCGIFILSLIAAISGAKVAKRSDVMVNSKR
jgi:hypothetical protein